MKLKELYEKRNNLIKEAQTKYDAFTKEEDKEKRDSIRNEWKELKEKVDAVKREIEDAEEMEALNKLEVENTDKNTFTPEQKADKQYDIFKAIREARKGNLSGLEKEMSEEVENEWQEKGVALEGFGIPEFIHTKSQVNKADEVTTTDNSNHITTLPASMLDIKYHPTVQLIQDLGIDVITGLRGKLPLAYDTPVTASYITEKSGSYSAAGVSNTSNTLEARALGFVDKFTSQYLVQTSPELKAGIMRKFKTGIVAGEISALFDEFDDITALSAYTGNTAVTLTMITALEAAIAPSDLHKYLTTPTLKGAMKRTLAGSADKMIWEGKEMNGYNAYASTYTNANNVIFGDFNSAKIGRFASGISILVDPYTSKGNEMVEYKVSTLSDVALSNPNAFSRLLIS